MKITTSLALYLKVLSFERNTEGCEYTKRNEARSSHHYFVVAKVRLEKRETIRGRSAKIRGKLSRGKEIF